jgi:23S rRNA pseudouridine1911/1915/1917 synthase
MRKDISLQCRIVYQSSFCIVINKLAGEAVEGAGPGMTDLPKELSSLLAADTELIEAVHRLDVPVTGCALFALTGDALSFLNSAFAAEDSLIQKFYWAIIEKPSFRLPESGKLIHWIETNSNKILRSRDCGVFRSPVELVSGFNTLLNAPEGCKQACLGIKPFATNKNKAFAFNEEAPGRKKASLRYRITGEGTNYLFLEIQLLSGRHHQIRAQLAAEGLRIKGDLKYGAKRSEKDGGIRLHARSLSFPDPLKNDEIITVTADPPVLDNLWSAFSENISRRDAEAQRTRR